MVMPGIDSRRGISTYIELPSATSFRVVEGPANEGELGVTPDMGG